MDNPNMNFKRSQSPKGRYDLSDDDDATRPRSRRTGTYFQSTVASSLKDDDWKSQTMNSYNESKMNASMTLNQPAKFERKLDRIGTVTEGMLDIKKSPVVSDDKEPKVMMNLKFLDKNDWKESPACFVCGRGFDKMKGVFTHHCNGMNSRVCGRAVCGECSTRKVSENRICDVCYVRATNPRAEERRKDMIKSKRATMENHRNQLKKEKDELHMLETKKSELERRMNEDKEAQETAKGNLQREKDKANDALQRKLDSVKKLKESLEVDKHFLREKEVELDEFRTKISALKLEIAQKKTIYQSKKEEFYRLQQQKMAYESSPSFLDVSGNRSEIMGSYAGNNTMSVMSNEGGANKISLSKNPIKI